MTARPPAFELEGISKRFGAVVANDSVDLAVEAGEIHGLVGENGAGKTTLMGVLYGIHRPDAGEIRVAGARRRFASPLDAIRAGLGMVHQHFMLFDSLTVAENVVFGSEPRRGGVLDRPAAARRVVELAERYGLAVDPRARVGGLPVGVRQRVEILKALYRQAAILILDEPTAVLTPNEGRALAEVLRRLAAEGTAIVFITHKLTEILTLCHRVTVLRNGRVTGSVAAADTSAEELSRLMMGQPQVPRAPATARDGLKEEAPPSRPPRSPKPLAAREGLKGEGRPPLSPEPLAGESLEVEGRGGRLAVAGIDLTVRAGEIVGVAGVAGNGQTELAEAIAGLRASRAGRIRLAGADLTAAPVRARRRAGLAYVPEDRDGTGLAIAASVADNVLMGFEEEPALVPRGLLDPSAIERRAAAVADRYRIRLGSVRDPAAALSGGNRQKLVVGRELAHAARVLLIEQPTRGVDLASIELIHRALLEFRAGGGAVLVISAELGELLALADRIVVMFGGRIAGELPRESATEERLGLWMAGAA